MSQPLCGLCGNPMPEGEEMFKYHGYSGDCPPKADTKGNDMAAPEPLANTDVANPPKGTERAEPMTDLQTFVKRWQRTLKSLAKK